MKTLKPQFSKNSYQYNLLKRNHLFAIYEQIDEGRIIAYEVIIIQNRQEGKTPSGQITEAGEYYPKTSQWGTYGWTYRHLQEAEKNTKNWKTTNQYLKSIKPENSKT